MRPDASEPAPLSKGRAVAFGLVVALFTLLCIELLLQGFYYHTAGDFLFRRVVRPYFEADPVRCYRLKPNLAVTHSNNEFSISIYTNAQGFRTDARAEEIAYAKEPGTLRMLNLGPSYAFGWGSDFEESYAHLLAEGLRATGRKVELINLGTPGQGTDAQRCWLAREGYKFAPDLVVQTQYGRVGGMSGGCPAVLECPVIAGGRLYIREPTLRRRAIAAAKNFALVFYGYHLMLSLAPAPVGEEAGMGRELRSKSERAVDDSDLEAVVAGYQGNTSFVKEVLGEQTAVAYIFIPLSFVVHPSHEPRWRHMRDTNRVGRRREATRAIDALRAHGVPIVDTTDALIAAGESEDMYFWLDTHLTPAGNRVVGEAVLPLLVTLLEEQR